MASTSVASRITRRHWLAEGCAVWTGLLSQWALGGIAAAKPNAKTKSVILIFNSGAPSHLDLWDPKPAAPDAVRGPLHAIQTNVPGIQVSELIPDLAARMNQ